MVVWLFACLFDMLALVICGLIADCLARFWFASCSLFCLCFVLICVACCFGWDVWFSGVCGVC